MAKTKEQLEEEINHTKYFSLKGDNIDALRKTEEYKLISNVFIYCQLNASDKQTARKLGYEIYTVCKKCLKNYDIERGIPFLHYFLRSLDNENKRLRIKEKRENGRCESFTDFEKPVNGGNLNIEDIFADSKNPSLEYSLIRLDTIRELFDIVDTIFKSKQNRIKPYLQKLLTAKYFDDIISYNSCRDTLKYAFIDNVLFEKQRYGGTISTQKEIAASFGKHEEDASRTIAKFERLVSAQTKN